MCPVLKSAVCIPRCARTKPTDARAISEWGAISQVSTATGSTIQSFHGICMCAPLSSCPRVPACAPLPYRCAAFAAGLREPHRPRNTERSSLKFGGKSEQAQLYSHADAPSGAHVRRYIAFGVLMPMAVMVAGAKRRIGSNWIKAHRNMQMAAFTCETHMRVARRASPSSPRTTVTPSGELGRLSRNCARFSPAGSR